MCKPAPRWWGVGIMAIVQLDGGGCTWERERERGLEKGRISAA